jgi:hypothetical protein
MSEFRPFKTIKPIEAIQPARLAAAAVEAVCVE